ncbi:MAG: PAS domain S-box protein [Kiritimatiellaeota bacterium]|nr:PAS domain S-box protein [Kiritimatiellota bacterium]
MIFGVLHGANLWLDGLLQGLPWPEGETLRLLLRLISFLCLLEFGFASLTASTRRTIGLGLYLLLLAIVALYANRGMATLQAVMHYAIGFPAVMLATFALARYAATRSGVERRQLNVAALLMAAYGVLVGLIPSHAPWWPAFFLNENELCDLIILPAQIWRGLLIFLIAMLLWWHYRRGQEQLLQQKGRLVWWHYLRWAAPIVCALLAAGWLITERVGAWTEQQMRADVLWRARMTAAAVNLDHLGKLTGTRADLASPQYQALKTQLMTLRRIDPRARAYYLAGLNLSNEIFFFADSEPPGSKDMALPGDIYRDATKTFCRVLRAGAPALEGPTADQRGVRISGLAPIWDAHAQVRALVGIDIRADDWTQIIAARRVWPILSVMLLLTMFMGAFLVVQRLQLLTDRLTESEVKYRSLFENSGMVMMLLDADTLQVVDVNPAAAAFCGYPREKMVGLAAAQFSPRSHAGLTAAVQAARQKPLHIRGPYFQVEGSERVVEVFISPQSVRNRQLVFLLLSDVTEQVRAENALQENEARLRKIYDSMAEHMLIGELVRDATGMVVNGVVVDCNTSFLRAFGKEREEVVGQLMTRAFGFLPPFLEQCGEVVESGQPQHFEIYLEPLSVHLAVSLFAPEPNRFALFAADITAQKYGEEQARVQNIALSAAANAIVIMDRAGKIIWTNPAFTVMTGYPLGEVQGRTLDLLRSNQHPPEFYAELTEAFRVGRVWSGEIINRRKDGSFYTEAMTVTPVRDSVGVITHFIEIKQDVTEQRALQQQFLQAQKMESVGRLAAGIAHDFNNQLHRYRANPEGRLCGGEPHAPAHRLRAPAGAGHSGRGLEPTD